jgi:hypothetical protein
MNLAITEKIRAYKDFSLDDYYKKDTVDRGHGDPAFIPFLDSLDMQNNLDLSTRSEKGIGVDYLIDYFGISLSFNLVDTISYSIKGRFNGIIPFFWTCYFHPPQAWSLYFYKLDELQEFISPEWKSEIMSFCMEKYLTKLSMTVKY